MTDVETRAITEVRAQVTQGRTVKFSPIRFDRDSSDLGGFVETISARALDKTLSETHNITADFDHAPGVILGTTQGGTLTLEVDRGGLWATVVLPDSRDDILELVRRHDINAASFSMRVTKDSWTSGDLPKRTVQEMQLYGVSLLSSEPAYRATVGSVSVRTYQQALEHRSLAAPVVQLPRRTETQVRYAPPLTLDDMRRELAEMERRMMAPRVADREAHRHEAATIRRAPVEEPPYRPLPVGLRFFNPRGRDSTPVSNEMRALAAGVKIARDPTHSEAETREQPGRWVWPFNR